MRWLFRPCPAQKKGLSPQPRQRMASAGAVAAFCYIIVLAAASAWADESEKLLTLQKSLSDVNSISGSFTQTKKLDFLAEPIVSKGNFYFSRPNYLRWEYLSPAPSGLVFEGDRVRAWTGGPGRRVDQPEAMAEAARMAAGQVMIWMDLNPEAIMAAYEVTVVRPEPLFLSVTPKRSGVRKFLKRLEVEFNSDGRTVRRVSLYEKESTTTLFFDGIRLNRPKPID